MVCNHRFEAFAFSPISNGLHKIGPVNRLPFIYPSRLLFFIFFPLPIWLELIVCVRYTLNMQKSTRKNESSTEKRKRDQPTGMKPFPRKTKQKQFDVNGLMVIHFCVVFVFEFSDAMQNTFAYCIREEFDRNAERKKESIDEPHGIFGANMLLMINKNLCTHLELMWRRNWLQKHN